MLSASSPWLIEALGVDEHDAQELLFWLLELEHERNVSTFGYAKDNTFGDPLQARLNDPAQVEALLAYGQERLNLCQEDGDPDDELACINRLLAALQAHARGLSAREA